MRDIPPHSIQRPKGFVRDAALQAFWKRSTAAGTKSLGVPPGWQIALSRPTTFRRVWPSPRDVRSRDIVRHSPQRYLDDVSDDLLRWLDSKVDDVSLR